MTSALERSRRQAVALAIRHRVASVCLVVLLGVAVGGAGMVAWCSYAIFVRPLPYPDANRLMRLRSYRLASGSFTDSTPLWLLDRLQNESEWVSASGSFQGAGSWVLKTGGGPIPVRVGNVSPGYLDALRVPVLRGRLLRGLDYVRGDVALISHDLWQRAYGGVSSVIGQRLACEGLRVEIVGVLPKGFFWPEASALPDVIVPSREDQRSARVRGSVLLRLRESVPKAVADERLRVLCQGPDIRGERIELVALQEALFGNRRSMLYLLLGATCALLLVACVNVSIVLSGWLREQCRELGTRMALGESWAGSVTWAMGPTVLVAALGGVAGVPIAIALYRLLLAPTFHWAPGTVGLSVDAAFAVICMVAIGLAALLCAGGPLSRLRALARVGPTSLLSGRILRPQSRHVPTLTLQLALTIALVSAAVNVSYAVARVVHADLGYSARDVVAVELVFPSSDRYVSESVRQRVVSDLCDRVAAIPGVAAAAATDAVPLADSAGHLLFHKGATLQERGLVYGVTPGFFRVLDISFLRGAAFGNANGPDRGGAAVVSAGVARRLFENDNPVGRTVDSDGRLYTVVGVVRDLRRSYFESPVPVMYVPYDGDPATQLVTVLVRSNASAAGIVAVVSGIVRQIDPALGIRSSLLEERLAAFVAEPRAVSILLALFSAIALVTTAVGIFGSASSFVASAQRSIALRMALGASRRSIVAVVVGPMLASGFVGGLAGLLGGWLVDRGLRGVFPEMGIQSVAGLMASAALMLCAVAVASIGPLIRAGRISPSEWLR